MTADQDLFRQEVLQARSEAAHGPSLDIRPISGRGLTLCALVMAGAVLALMTWGQYTRKEHVAGTVQAREGVAQVVTPDAGTVLAVHVKEGQAVKAGQPLLDIGQSRWSELGDTQALAQASLTAQQQQLQQQADGRRLAREAERNTLLEREAQARQELALTDEEMQRQLALVTGSTALLAKWQPLLQDRIVSELQYAQQEQVVHEQRARLQSLQRQRVGHAADMVRARQDRERLHAEGQAEQAALQRESLGLSQEQVLRGSQRRAVLNAPIDGVVSGLMLTAGQAVPASAVVASVAPEHAGLDAVLRVPSTGIGFVRPGQKVRVALDAFPYQRFGHVPGVVASVSAADVPGLRSGEGDPRAMFLVRVTLQQDHVKAYGQRLPLRPGHTLAADIELDRRPVLRWMLDPLLAFSGRL